MTVITLNCVTTDGDTISEEKLLEIARANDEFGFELLNTLEKREFSQRKANGSKPKNLLISPFSLSTIFTLAMTGSAGKTYDEIKNVLGFQKRDTTDTQLIAGYKTLLQSLNSSKNALKLANSIALQNEHPFLPTYLSIAEKSFKTNVFSVDFKKTPNRTANQINNLINEKTDGEMAKLLKKRLTRHTRMAFINALHFKGAWKDPFDKALSTVEEFNYDEHNKVPVPMMHKHFSEIKWASYSEGQLLELPYKGEEQSMFLFLPKEIFCYDIITLSSVYSLLFKRNNGPYFFKDWSENLKPVEINLHLPRFLIESTVNMKPTLQMMGINVAFDKKSADFSRMTGDKNLRVSKIMHQTLVEVNEAGSKASTESEKPIPAQSSDTIDVKFNRPFLFAIRDNRLQMTLFAGVVQLPKIRKRRKVVHENENKKVVLLKKLVKVVSFDNSLKLNTSDDNFM